MSLSFASSPLYIILILLIAGGLTWLMYRSTKDILPQIPRVLLSIFRFVVLSIVGILLLQPMLNSTNKVLYLPIITVLQDQSESLVIQKDSAFVQQEYPGILSRFLGAFDPNEYAVNPYGFSADLEADLDPDSLSFEKTGTNISGALKDVQALYQNQNLGAIVLISDGISTEGVNPLYTIEGMGQPVYTVLLGDTTIQQDVRIKEVLFNEIAYLNNEMPIRVKVESSGFDNANLKVSLIGGGKTIGTRPITLTRNRPEGEVDFLVKPESVGVQQYQIRITSLPNEITYRNNSQRIYINVLETRVKIALFAGSPHPDLGALRTSFDREESYELTEFILKSPGRFYESPDRYNLRDFDLIILHNYPQSFQDRAMVEKIAAEVKERNKPVIHFVGAYTSLRTLQPMFEHMALAPKSFNAKSEEVIAEFTRSYRDHSTYTFGDNWISWANNSPPIYRNQSDWVPKSTAEVLATSKIKNISLDYPVYALQSHLGRKNMVFVGENFWRMRAHSYVEADNFDLFDDWLFNNIKWLIVSDDKRKFKVQPSKRIFSGSEPIIFKGQAYDDSYNPVTGVDIKLTLKSPDGKDTDYYLTERGEARYSAELYNLGEGTYSYIAEGRKDEISIGKDQGQFSIGKSNVEHYQLQADQGLLRQVALRTGGQFIYARNLEELPAKIKALPELVPESDFKRSRKSLHEYAWVLALILGMLAVEWVVRKLYSLL